METWSFYSAGIRKMGKGRASARAQGCRSARTRPFPVNQKSMSSPKPGASHSTKSLPLWVKPPGKWVSPPTYSIKLSRSCLLYTSHLQALVSMVTAGSAFADIPRRGGCFESGMMAWAFAVSNHQMDATRMVRDVYKRQARETPSA